MIVQSVDQMLADIGDSLPEEQDGPNRPPHPDSLNGPLKDWCKKPAEQQIWFAEEAGFERRLKARVQEMHKLGIPKDGLEAFTRRHRTNWRRKRATQMPKSMRRTSDDYFDQLAEPLMGGPGR